jgi:hypothetical protein
MRTAVALLGGWLCVLLAAAPARAQDDETPEEGADQAGEEQASPDEEEKPADGEEPAENEELERQINFGHQGQPGLRVGLNGGYRMVFRYDKSPLCAEYDPTKEFKKQQKFCGHVAPFALDLGLSFAPADAIEPFLWARFGLHGEDETDTDPVVILGAGVRVYTMSDSAFKIFIEPGFGFELEGGGTDLSRANGLEYKTDLVFHLAAGPHIDVSRNFGFYFDAGITTGILRSIHSTLELTGGIQGRAF